jgi:hypothetical protein
MNNTESFKEAREAINRLAKYMDGAPDLATFAMRLNADRESPFHDLDVTAHITALINTTTELLEAVDGVFYPEGDHEH